MDDLVRTGLRPARQGRLTSPDPVTASSRPPGRPATIPSQEHSDKLTALVIALGVLNTTTYTIVVLVALVTSIMAPPVLRHAMSRITQTDEGLVRKIDHDTWDGVERVQRAVVPCSRPVRRPTLRGVRADLRARRGQVTVTGRGAAAPFNATVEGSRKSPTAEWINDGRASADWAGSGGEHGAGRAGFG